MSNLTSFENPLLSRALDFARLSLAGKKRKSGEEFIDHCLVVTEDLMKFKIEDSHTLAAALLHHSVTEGAATMKDIRSEFSEDIAGMIEAFDKLRIIKMKPGMEDEFVEILRKMFLVLAKDLRVVLLKLVDLQDNCRTLNYLEPEKRVEISQEVIEIFAPLAERLGMGEMRGKLQDMVFPYLTPEGYKWVSSYSRDRLSELGKGLLPIKGKITMKLKDGGVRAQLQSRVKHAYSLYTKLMRPEINKNLDKIYDLIALRIIVDTTEDCYKALDIVHTLFRPLPEPVSDYIAHPKPSGYQSIHTRVYGPKNLPFEIQIRTHKMHEEAEFGVASHWNYSEKKESGLSDAEISKGFATSAEKLEWVKNLCEWQKEISNNQEFLSTVKTDFFGERIFCFTPKGDVKDLPSGATPIDFAYQVHTGMGNLATGAKVNGKMVTLNTKLNNGDVVEILLSKDTKKKPGRDWLGFVATSSAKRQIKRAHALTKVNG